MYIYLIFLENRERLKKVSSSPGVVEYTIFAFSVRKKISSRKLDEIKIDFILHLFKQILLLLIIKM